MRRGTCLQLSARGELDLSSVDTLEEALADAWPTLNGVILIDLTACSFIDSSIVTLLLRWHERAHGARTSLVVLATGAVMATLELTGVRERLTVVDDGRAQRAAAGAGSAGGLE